MMKNPIVAGALVMSVFAWHAFGMDQGYTSEEEQVPRVIRTFEEQEKLNKQFFDAAERGDLSRVEELLNRKADVNAKGNGGFTPLNIACYKGRVDVVKRLIACNDVTVTIASNKGYTPLHSACISGNSALVAILLGHKDTNLFAEDKQRQTPLDKACIDGHVAIVELLLKSLIKSVENWKEVRLLFIGHKKEPSESCHLAKLPREILHHIVSFCDNKIEIIQKYKDLICHQDSCGYTPFVNAAWTIREHFRYILDPRLWQDDRSAQKSYNQLRKYCIEDEEKKDEHNGKSVQ